MDADYILNLSKRFSKLAQSKVGAGILFICTDDNTALFAQRSQEVAEPGTWGIPGGSLDPGEELSETAIRETKEELGSLPQGAKLIDTLIKKDKEGEYYIFVMIISEEQKAAWIPQIKLNYESDQFKWFPLGQMPENLHSAIEIIRT